MRKGDSGSEDQLWVCEKGLTEVKPNSLDNTTKVVGCHYDPHHYLIFFNFKIWTCFWECYHQFTFIATPCNRPSLTAGDGVLWSWFSD